MQITLIFRTLGLLLILLSTTFIPPLLVELGYQDGSLLTFILSIIITFGLGFTLWFPFRRIKLEPRTQDGFLIVVLFWFATSLIGALPFYWMVSPSLSLTDAIFESTSGITTTGATILTHIESLPHSILYYRQQLQFLGGISIILLAIAMFPTLRVGGMQLFRSEFSGIVKDDKLMPRMRQAAKAIWMVYLLLILLCLLCYRLAGMTWFDAITHSFSTVSTGGFSTHDASLGYFQNPSVKLIAVFFMLLGAVNFNLHFLAFKKKSLHVYLRDPEFQFFIRVLLGSALIIWAGLALFIKKPLGSMVTLDAFFEVISFTTTTGFTPTAFNLPSFMPMLLLFCCLIGGCAGSTSGGLKAIRVLLLQKQGSREIQRLIHPQGQYVVKLGEKPIETRVIEAIWGFFAIYIVVFSLLLLLLLVVEEDFYAIYSALIAALSNTGRGLGQVADTFASLSNYAKWILSLAMLAGRLEILTLLVILSPAFWRR